MSEEKKKVRILLYRTPWKLKLKYWVNWLISIRTLSKWSHIEIWTPDENGEFIPYVTMGDMGGYMQPVGTCYTSTMRGDHNGTVSRDASGVLDFPEHWDYIELELTKREYAFLMWMMNGAVEENNGYAMRDIWKFIIGDLHRPDNSRYICSEFVNDMLCSIGILKGWGIISPIAVAKKLLKLGCKVKSLVDKLKGSEE
jgi:hypothetical protein